MPIANRTEFIEYVLRSLGAPVVEVNVDPDQVEDNINDAISFYLKYHSQGMLRIPLKYQVTALDITNGRIPIPDHIIEVIRVIPFSMTAVSGTLAEVQYQNILSDMFTITQSDMIGYDMTMRHITLLNHLLNPVPVTQFNRHMGYLTFSNGMDYRIKEGDWIVMECYRAVDPAEFASAWNEIWLKRYATALVKKQWATNIKKFAGMVLPGGITLDGPGMYQEAMGEIDKLEQEIMNNMPPSGFLMG